MSGKSCDSCKLSGSLVFCLSDSAALCLACDARIHGPGSGAPMASRHARVWMCEVCEQAPASVTCKADAAALCATCDSDIHSANPLARRHERVPVVPFHDCPTRSGSAAGLFKASEGGNEDAYPEEKAETTSWLGTEGQELKAVDCLFGDVDPYLDLEYAASMDGGFGGTSDSVVPVQGKPVAPHRRMAPSSAEHCMEIDFSRPKPSFTFATLSHSVSNVYVSSSSLDVGVVPDGNSSAMADISNPFGSSMKFGIEYPAPLTPSGAQQTTPLLSQDREARVLRYREKRKNRKFEKTIRYASRKAYAEVRPRIKGRFAKRTETAVEMDGIYAASTVLMADTGYGVVPTF
ncbi:hypothetical protein ACLOJK_030612 [Asimina triloba]